mmetsp:Transcript_23606/g.57853  ORF Transcript_23606/g.57853 Transcript_23606/m.57853 type:complete len:308 (+) Transcript_23606:346-1269(+)
MAAAAMMAAAAVVVAAMAMAMAPGRSGTTCVASAATPARSRPTPWISSLTWPRNSLSPQTSCGGAATVAVVLAVAVAVVAEVAVVLAQGRRWGQRARTKKRIRTTTAGTSAPCYGAPAAGCGCGPTTMPWTTRWCSCTGRSACCCSRRTLPRACTWMDPRPPWWVRRWTARAGAGPQSSRHTRGPGGRRWRWCCSPATCSSFPLCGRTTWRRCTAPAWRSTSSSASCPSPATRPRTSTATPTPRRRHGRWRRASGRRGTSPLFPATTACSTAASRRRGSCGTSASKRIYGVMVGLRRWQEARWVLGG